MTNVFRKRATFEPTEIKLEGFFYIRSDSDYIKFGGKTTVYLSVPDRCVELVRKLGIDLHKKPKDAIVEVEVIDADGLLRLVYTLKPNPALQELLRKPIASEAKASEVNKA